MFKKKKITRRIVIQVYSYNNNNFFFPDFNVRYSFVVLIRVLCDSMFFFGDVLRFHERKSRPTWIEISAGDTVRRIPLQCPLYFTVTFFRCGIVPSICDGSVSDIVFDGKSDFIVDRYNRY